MTFYKPLIAQQKSILIKFQLDMATLKFSCLVLALCCLSVSAQDENLIDWTGDDNFIKNGESHTVQSPNSISHILDTLRVFTGRKKNCYNISSVKRGRVLVRASFYYGNYDNKSSPPTFDLQFEGNHWATVETSSTEYVYHEVTYVMAKDSISVCVAQTNPGQFPFVSAIEVRGLEPSMYNSISDSNPLFLRRRVAFGSNATIRFPNDLYDRLWIPEVPRNGMIPVSSDAIFSSPITIGDQPPPAVLKNAVIASSPNSSIDLFMGFPTVETPVYVNVYFSEITRLKPNETRSFRVFKDNKSFSEPVFPPYENCTQLYTSDITASTNTTFSLVPTNVSTLPPLINAMEVFFVGDDLTSGTNKRDVQGLATLQKAFGLLQDWGGDPCLPAPYTWDWINCSSHSTPRVTALFLGSLGLSGLLPNFSSMDALQTIDLHNNSLQGPIPAFLGTLPNLKTLVTGNPDLCTSCSASSNNPGGGSSGSNKNNNIMPILFGTIIQSIVVLFLRENLL
ncbi:hypothetical protein DH2020_021379 [Rehmannia glutinosa]|uniref:Malectin-like domain-containing protein n=1 Tax=Rehmannia glutinosa TaxID=99300 RepID=A0ABR0WER4_REHGL